MPARTDLHAATGWTLENDLQALSQDERDVIVAAEPYTMTGLAKLHALLIAVRYVIDAKIPGEFAECGVWRGGSVQAMAGMLLRLGVTDRELFLFDTFQGMTEPDERDVSVFEPRALDVWSEAQRQEQRMYADDFRHELVNEAAVRSVVLSSGYPADRVVTVPGPVENTLPEQAPQRLALLRLDTDWYQSTRHELETLYPRLSPGGVLIVDDYGHWQGAQRAVDEYFAAQGETVLLSRVDWSCRLAVKPQTAE